MIHEDSLISNYDEEEWIDFIISTLMAGVHDSCISSRGCSLHSLLNSAIGRKHLELIQSKVKNYVHRKGYCSNT